MSSPYWVTRSGRVVVQTGITLKDGTAWCVPAGSGPPFGRYLRLDRMRQATEREIARAGRKRDSR